MPSSSSNPKFPSVQFPQIFDVALEEYTKKTKNDIKTDPLFAKLQDCNSSDAVLKVLEEQALAFERYRKGDRKVQLMGQLKPIVEILFRLATKDDVKEGIVSVRLTRYNYSLRKFIIRPADISTSEGHIYWYWSPARGVCHSLLFPLVSESAVLTPNPKAAKKVSDDYDALIELFESFERYLRRLQVFTKIPLALGKILVEIMVELLGVLALTTRQIQQRRFSGSALTDTSH
jgi:hypothetical protein